MEMMGANTFLKKSYEIALYHHEKHDGTGYPNNLKEREIPISAAIVSIVDIYDALVSLRPYKKAFTHEKAVEIIPAGG
jgi:response regulator RpfG family c-di-GMP phosphodiesterase